VTVGRALGLIAGLVPSAQSIRPADYLPLGQGAQWQYERTFKAIDKDDVAIVHVEATATSAADFTISKVTVTLFKREVGGDRDQEGRPRSPFGAKAPGDLEAVHPRQFEVEEDYLGLHRTSDLQGRMSVVRHRNVLTLKLENPGERFPRSIQSRIEGRFPSSLSCSSVAPGVPDSLPSGGSVIVRSTCGRWATACERNFPTPTRLGP